MPSKTVWTIVIVTVIILVVAGALYWQLQTNSNDVNPLNQIDALDDTLDTSQAVPKTNPLDQVLPDQTPLEKTNPFKDSYKNPFE